MREQKALKRLLYGLPGLGFHLYYSLWTLLRILNPCDTLKNEPLYPFLIQYAPAPRLVAVSPFFIEIHSRIFRAKCYPSPHIYLFYTTSRLVV